MVPVNWSRRRDDVDPAEKALSSGTHVPPDSGLRARRDLPPFGPFVLQRHISLLSPRPRPNSRGRPTALLPPPPTPPPSPAESAAAVSCLQALGTGQFPELCDYPERPTYAWTVAAQSTAAYEAARRVAIPVGEEVPEEKEEEEEEKKKKKNEEEEEDVAVPYRT